jgi:HAMP domain-containing protein
VSGVVLALAWPWKALVGMGIGIGAFAGLALWVNVKNRQRSTLFQIASAAALTSTSVATCLAATGAIATWCLWFWLLAALQATAGILVVHARLDARIALKGTTPASMQFRRAAEGTVGAIACAAVTAAAMGKGWVAAALVVAAAGYGYDLMRQREAGELQRPLKAVGMRGLVLSSVYALLLIVGLW